MRTLRRSIAISTVAAGIAFGIAGTAGATPAVQSGNCFDTQDTNCGGWNATAPGVLGRPFVKYFAITNGGTETVIIDNRGAQAATPNPLGGADVYPLVSPINACKSGQAPAPGVCYNPPNRVTVSLSRPPSGGGGLAYSDNFSAGGATTPPVNADSIVHMVIGFRAGYTSLRWSWVNGAPTYWKSTVTPFGGDVEIKFRPRTMPWMTGGGGCSAIPVNTCDIQQASEERLMPQLLLSMDDTLSAGLTGVLFGSSDAFIGSLEAGPLDSPDGPTLTYGIAAPHLNANGSDRRGTFFALVPEAILGLFGTSTQAFNPAILAVERTNGTGSFNVGWSPWSAEANGTAGQFLTITDISFSAPKFDVRKRSSASGGSAGASGAGQAPARTGKKRLTLKARKTLRLTALASGLDIKVPRGAKLSAKVSTRKVCKATSTGIQGLKHGTCRATLTIQPRKGKATKRSVSFPVLK